MLTGLAIKLFARKMLGKAANIAATLWGWVKCYPWQAAFLIALCALLWAHFKTIPAIRSDLADMTAARDAEKLAHDASIRSWVDARKQAAELDRQNVERVKSEYAAKLKGITDENTILRNTVRGNLADRMRGRSASVNIGSGRTTDLPVISTMSGGALPDTGAAIVSGTDALICADNYSQLVGIIAAWEAAAGVDVNE